MNRAFALTDLTPQQRATYDLLLEGLQDKEIARRLNIEAVTAKGRVGIILRKARCTRVHLILNHYKRFLPPAEPRCPTCGGLIVAVPSALRVEA